MDTVHIVLILIIITLLYILSKPTIENLVAPYNVFTAPANQPLDEDQITSINNRFATLVALINNTSLSIVYKTVVSSAQDMVDIFTIVLNTLAPSKYTIVSVDGSGQLTLTGVTIQDTISKQTLKFSNVSFIVNTSNGTIVERVVVTPSAALSEAAIVRARDQLSPDTFFRIKNPLHLFYPFATSDDEMTLNLDNPVPFNAALFEMAINAESDLINGATYDTSV